MFQALLLHLLLVSSAPAPSRAAGEKPGPQPSKFVYRQPPLPPPSSLPSSSLLLGPPQLASPHHRRAPPAAPAPAPATAPAPALARSAARTPQPSAHRGPAAAQKPHAGHLDAFDSAGSASPLGFFRSDLVDDLDNDEPDSPDHTSNPTSAYVNDHNNDNNKDDNDDSNGDGDDDDKADNVVAPPASVLTSSSGAGNPASESEALLAAMYPCGDAELAMLRGYRQRRRVWRPSSGAGPSTGPNTGPGTGKHAKHSRQVVVIVPNPVKVSSIKGVG